MLFLQHFVLLIKNRFSRIERIEIGQSIHSIASNYLPFVAPKALSLSLVNDSFLSQVTKQFSHSLKHLNISSNKLISAQGVSKILSVCKKLVSLDISNCSNLTQSLPSLIIPPNSNSDESMDFFKNITSSLKTLYTCHIKTITFDHVMEFQRRAPHVNQIVASHLVSFENFDMKKFKELVTSSPMSAQALYESALCNNFQNAFSDLFTHVFQHVPLQSVINGCLINGNYKVIPMLNEVGYKVAEQVPISVVCQVIRQGQYQVLSALVQFGYKVDLVPVESVQMAIEAGDVGSISSLRMAKYPKWNQVSLSSVISAIKSGHLPVLEQVRDLNFMNVNEVPIDVIHEVIAKGFVSILKHLISCKYNQIDNIDPTLVASSPQCSSVMTLLRNANYKRYSEVAKLANVSAPPPLKQAGGQGNKKKKK